MLIEIKLYGGLVCCGEDLPCYGLKNFQLEVPQGSTLGEVHQLLNLNPSTNLVSIVNGQAQSPQYVLNGDATISIFPPMADRKYDLFARLK